MGKLSFIMLKSRDIFEKKPLKVLLFRQEVMRYVTPFPYLCFPISHCGQEVSSAFGAVLTAAILESHHCVKQAFETLRGPPAH